MATPGAKRVCSTPTRSKLQPGIEMLKGQFNRVAVREQLFAIFFPNQRSLPLKIFERFFFLSCGKSDCYVCQHFKNDIAC